MTQRFDDSDLDTQPEVDQPGYRLLSLGTGLLLGCGLILGALLGGLAGHFLFSDAFGIAGDIVVGSIIGAIVIGTLAVGGTRYVSHRMQVSYEHAHSPVAH